MDERIEKAKREYPIGTQFYPAHTTQRDDNYCIITTTNFRYDDSGNLIAITLDNKTWSSFTAADFKLHGTINYERIVWRKANNKWATIKKRVNPCSEIFPSYDPKAVQSLTELWEEMSKKAAAKGNSIHEGIVMKSSQFEGRLDRSAIKVHAHSLYGSVGSDYRFDDFGLRGTDVIETYFPTIKEIE